MAERVEFSRTLLEQQVEQALQELGLDYASQSPTRTGFVIDFKLPSLGIALEVDGPHHDRPRARRRDSFRDYQLRREGFKVIRLSWRDIAACPDLPSLLQQKLGLV